MIYQYKTCSGCNKNKTLDNFWNRKKSYDGKKSRCKECIKDSRRACQWIHTFNYIQDRCNNSKAINYKYYGAVGIKCKITLEEVKQLYFRDNGYLMKNPSIDRINSKGNYEYNNCRFIEMTENSSRGGQANKGHKRDKYKKHLRVYFN